MNTIWREPAADLPNQQGAELDARAIKLMNEETNTPVSAMLVTLSFKFGRQGGEDEGMTGELCQNHNAESSAVKATKRTICKQAFEPLRKIQNEFRSAVSRVTIPWDTKGVAFCKPSAIAKVIGFRNHYGPLFQEAKNELLANYEAYKVMTRQQLGNTWKEEEFPKREDLQMNVYYKMDITAMPQSDAIRRIKDIDEELVKELVKNNDERIQRGIRAGMATAYTRLMAPLQHMVDVLTDDKPRIYETLVGNVRDIIDQIPSLNLADDPALNQFAERAAVLIKDLTAEELRGDKPEVKVVRKKVAQQAADILATFGQTGIRRFAA